MSVRDWASSKFDDRARLTLWGYGPNNECCGTCFYEDRQPGPEQSGSQTGSECTRDYCTAGLGQRVKPSWESCGRWEKR